MKSVTEKTDKSKIFIVHGNDDAAKLEVARFIEKLGFEPIILHEQVSQSKTIIEKIEEYSDVGFGVVLYTSCEYVPTCTQDIPFALLRVNHFTSIV